MAKSMGYLAGGSRELPSVLFRPLPRNVLGKCRVDPLEAVVGAGPFSGAACCTPLELLHYKSGSPPGAGPTIPLYKGRAWCISRENLIGFAHRLHRLN
jgi:hypothetical protein